MRTGTIAKLFHGVIALDTAITNATGNDALTEIEANLLLDRIMGCVLTATQATARKAASDDRPAAAPEPVVVTAAQARDMDETLTFNYRSPT